jgi:ribosomal protein L11 methyltransferase
MQWMEITVITSQEAKEAAAEILYRAGASGVVVEDTVSPLLAEDVEDYSPESETAIPLEEVRLIAYLPLLDTTVSAIEAIRAEIQALWEFGLDPGKGEISLAEIQEEDWATAWKQYYKPMAIGQSIIVKPTWESVQGSSDKMVIELDPGMAFGTGTHPTTIMCLEFLERMDLHGLRVLDLGCGSGILSVAAAKLGAGEVVALDYDPVAVAVARENVALNGVAHVVTVSESNLFAATSGNFDLIVANIIARIIVDALPGVMEHLNGQGHFLASGIIRDKTCLVEQALRSHGLTVIEKNEQGEWVSLLAKRTGC